MKWMGWSWSDLNECPEDHRLEVIEMINEEQERLEAIRNGS
jgi:hypothetical protein